MSDDENADICGAENRSGDPCQQVAGWGTDHVGEGRCKLHGGVTGDNHGPPEGTANAEKHGLRADPEKWFDRHRDDVEPFVRALVASYLDDAPFGWDDVAKVDQLVEVAIDQARLRESNEYLDEFLTEQTVSVTENGQEVTRLEENPAHMPRDRIKRTNAKILKELGIMDDPDSAQADAAGDLASAIEEKLN